MVELRQLDYDINIESPVAAVLATLDEAHIPLAESILRSYFQGILLEKEKR